ISSRIQERKSNGGAKQMPLTPLEVQLERALSVLAQKQLDLSALGAAILQPEKAARFIQAIMDSTVLMDEARMIPMTANQYDIDRIGFGSRILHKATENTAPSSISAPTVATNSIKVFERIAEAEITDTALENNIERGNLENTVLDLAGAQVGLDMEEGLLKSDTTLAGSDADLGDFDGWLKLAANQLDGGASPPDFDPTDVRDMFNKMLNAVPRKYLKNRNAWRFYCSWNIKDAYRNVLGDRGTILGDKMLTGFQQLSFKGIPVVPLANMPDGECLLVYPVNTVYGIQRKIRME